MKINVIEPLAISQEKMDRIKALFLEKGHEIKFYSDRNKDPQEIVRRCEGAEVVVIANLPFPAEVVETLPDLKLLAVAFTGLDHVALDTCRQKGIEVRNSSGYSNINVAELTIGLMIDLSRNITRLDPVTRKGGTKDGLVGFDLAGKTVGIIGLGAIGQYLAGILKGFGCRILSVNRGKPVPEGLTVELTDMDTLLRESDFVSLHCPLNDSTRGLIGEKEFGMMKKSAYLVNCARGPVVDDNALYNALLTGEIAGAGLDVFAVEPPLNRDNVPYLDLENVILTPHVAFATKEAFIRRADIVVNNILDWEKGIYHNK